MVKSLNFQIKKWPRLFFLVAAALLSLSCFAYTSNSDNQTETQVKYLIVIIPENCSFDRVFGTYPHMPSTQLASRDSRQRKTL